jgi:hypothetical protein
MPLGVEKEDIEETLRKEKSKKTIIYLDKIHGPFVTNVFNRSQTVFLRLSAATFHTDLAK